MINFIVMNTMFGVQILNINNILKAYCSTDVQDRYIIVFRDAINNCVEAVYDTQALRDTAFAELLDTIGAIRI
jgi:hypothetical protein